MKRKPVAIIGAGPAGISAAIQLKRYGIDFFLFEKKNVGGLINNANLIENLPGFPRGVPGLAYLKLLKDHLKLTGIEVIYETVVDLKFRQGKFSLKTKSDSFEVDFCIAASGTKPVMLEEKFGINDSTHRIFYEAAECADIRDSSFAIIGCGDAAFDYGLNLAGRNNRIDIFCRGSKAKALPLLIERAETNPNISISYSRKVKKINERSADVSLEFKEGHLLFDYLLVAIGRNPETGFINTKDLTIFESNDRFYFAGDVNNGLFRQASIAIGEGIKAAMDIYFKVKDAENEDFS